MERKFFLWYLDFAFSFFTFFFYNAYFYVLKPFCLCLKYKRYIAISEKRKIRL